MFSRDIEANPVQKPPDVRHHPADGVSSFCRSESVIVPIEFICSPVEPETEPVQQSQDNGHGIHSLRIFIDAVYQKLPEVIVAIELTAAVMGAAEVFNAAREARRKMHWSEPWRLDKQKAKFD